MPKATRVVFECEGRFKESIQAVYKKFMTEWLPFSGYQYAGLPDIEVYPMDNRKPLGGHAEVWISVKKDEED